MIWEEFEGRQELGVQAAAPECIALAALLVAYFRNG